MVQLLHVKRFLVTVPLCLLFQYALGQKAFQRLGEEHLKSQVEKWDLQESDIASLRLSDQYKTKHNGVTHLYYNQTFSDIDVINAVSGVHVTSEGKVFYATNGFEANLVNRIRDTEPAIDAEFAINMAMKNLGIESSATLELVEKQGNHSWKYACDKVSKQEITASLKYYPIVGQQDIKLVWEVTIAPNNTSDHWKLRVDAIDARVIDKNNLKISCHFPAKGLHAHDASCYHTTLPSKSKRSSIATAALPSQGEESFYNVFPIPVESPIHGERQKVASPADPIASPTGWHDIDGDEVADYTVTRGNNAFAYLDEDGNNIVDTTSLPDGGESLAFDFPFIEDAAPDSSTDAALVQAFYMVNVMHDFAYRYGFDEAAGNFQANNRGKGGRAGDHVLVEVRDGSDTNNASFSTPPDGTNGRMQIYLWDAGQSKILEVLEPAAIQGKFEAGTADYGPAITEEEAFEGFVAEAFDGSRDADKGCDEIVNEDEVAGKIAMVNRGLCFFEQKTANVEAAGAIGLIICNFEDNTIGMAGVDNITNPQIPTVSLRSSDCATIRLALREGVKIRLQIPSTTGPEFLDAAFDNGVVAHEFGHGISLRLTGGPSQSGCLGNDEQMGEGWSDFFTLVMSASPEDAGRNPHGIGNYLVRDDVDGVGIRRFPYSTDKNVNNQTYEDIMGTGTPHSLGEVWTSVLWDLYWKFVEVYGWDDDIYGGTGGNNIAVQLVMDGMKLQDCQPGFLDGRNSLLAADVINNDGQNQCLIWEVFAARGLGWDADQNSNRNRDDAIQGFETMPECVKELKIAKTVTPNIRPGEDIGVLLTVINHKDETVENTVVIDEIPAGTQFVGLSDGQDLEFEVSGNEIRVDLGALSSGQTRKISYTLQTSPDLVSTEQFFDDFETSGDNFIPAVLDEGIDIWELVDSVGASGQRSWFVPSTTRDNDQALVMLAPFRVTGNQPTLHFKQSYRIEAGNDGGIVEISTDGGFDWVYLSNEKIFRNGYTGRLNYSAFSIPFLRAYWGQTNGFEDTYADLSDYIGEEIQVRFRFGTDTETDENVDPGRGWNIDDFLIFDMQNYNTEACVSGNAAAMACTFAEGRGTIVDPSSLMTTDVEDNLVAQPKMDLYPNPTQDHINVRLSGMPNERFNLGVFTMDGRMISNNQLDGVSSAQLDHVLDTSRWPEGIYLVKITSQQLNLVQKFIKN